MSEKLHSKLASLEVKHAQLSSLVDERMGSPDQIKGWKVQKAKIKRAMYALREWLANLPNSVTPT